MKKLLLLSVSLFIVSSSAFSQAYSAVPTNIRATNLLQRLVYLTPSDLAYGIPLPEKQLIGDAYLVQTWRSGSILLYGTEKTVDGFPIRLDLLRDELEIRTKSGIKVIEGKKIKSFVWIDSLGTQKQFFINSKEYKNENNVPYEGFFEVLVDGKMPLFSLTDAYIKKADYSPQLNVGNRDDKIIKRAKLYYASNGVAQTIPRSKKKFVAIFGDKKDAVTTFMSTNQLSENNEAHLLRIFDYYNSLN